MTDAPDFPPYAGGPPPLLRRQCASHKRAWIDLAIELTHLRAQEPDTRVLVRSRYVSMGDAEVRTNDGIRFVCTVIYLEDGHREKQHYDVVRTVDDDGNERYSFEEPFL